MEQEVLNLSEVMRPLSSSFTMGDGDDESNSSGGSSKKNTPPGEPGRPEKPMEEKSDKTIANINAM